MTPPDCRKNCVSQAMTAQAARCWHFGLRFLNRRYAYADFVCETLVLSWICGCTTACSNTACHGMALHITAHKSTVQHSAVELGTARHSIAQQDRLSTVQHRSAQCNPTQHIIVRKGHCSAAQHSTAWHGTARQSMSQHGTGWHHKASLAQCTTK